jgi:hypothetical protein
MRPKMKINNNSSTKDIAIYCAITNFDEEKDLEYINYNNE